MPRCSIQGPLRRVSVSLYDFVSLAWIQWIVSTAVRRLIGPRSWRRERMKATTWRCRTQTVFVSLTFRRNNKALCSSWSTGLFKEDVCYAEVMVKGIKCFMQRLYWGEWSVLMQRLYWGEWSVLCRGYTEGNEVFYAEVILRGMKCFMQRLYWGEWSVLYRGYTEGNEVFYAEVILRGIKCFMLRLYCGEWSVLYRGYTEGNEVFYTEVILRGMKCFMQRLYWEEWSQIIPSD